MEIALPFFFLGLYVFLDVLQVVVGVVAKIVIAYIAIYIIYALVLLFMVGKEKPKLSLTIIFVIAVIVLAIRAETLREKKVYIYKTISNCSFTDIDGKTQNIPAGHIVANWSEDIRQKQNRSNWYIDFSQSFTWRDEDGFTCQAIANERERRVNEVDDIDFPGSLPVYDSLEKIKETNMLMFSLSHWWNSNSFLYK